MRKEEITMTDLFKQFGIKKTEHREKILNILEKSKIPMTAEDIFNQTQNISLATVYRAVETFAQKGVVTKISVGDDEKKYFEFSANRHRHYAVCIKCKHMEYIDVCPIHDIALDNFRITGHRLELYGYCKNCMRR